MTWEKWKNLNVVLIADRFHCSCLLRFHSCCILIHKTVLCSDSEFECADKTWCPPNIPQSQKVDEIALPLLQPLWVCCAPWMFLVLVSCFSLICPFPFLRPCRCNYKTWWRSDITQTLWHCERLYRQQLQSIRFGTNAHPSLHPMCTYISEKARTLFLQGTKDATYCRYLSRIISLTAPNLWLTTRIRLLRCRYVSQANAYHASVLIIQSLKTLQIRIPSKCLSCLHTYHVPHENHVPHEKNTWSHFLLLLSSPHTSSLHINSVQLATRIHYMHPFLHVPIRLPQSTSSIADTYLISYLWLYWISDSLLLSVCCIADTNPERILIMPRYLSYCRSSSVHKRYRPPRVLYCYIFTWSLNLLNSFVWDSLIFLSKWTLRYASTLYDISFLRVARCHSHLLQMYTCACISQH
jgi:hypothetical protein